VKPRTDLPPRLLVVDDEESFLILAARALEDQGFDVTAVSNGDEAVRLLRERTFDLALLDIRMFEIDGLELLRIIRKESPTTDCIMITGFHEVEIAVEAIKLGAKEFLTKPIGINDLVTRVKSVLRAHVAEHHLRELQAEYSSKILFDLLSPLHNLKSAIEFLVANNGEQTREQQATILQSMNIIVDSLDGMLNDMIDLSMFESGRIDIERIPTNLDELIPAICARYRPHADAKHLTVAIDIMNSIPTLEVDPIRIEQVIANLLQNAITHTRSGGIIRVSVESKHSRVNGTAREMIEVTVADTGVGIPQEKLPYIFDKYKKVMSPDRRENTSSGLGLAICRSIVEAHKGTITVESVVGEGSTFTLLLPAEIS
jgi:two-component system, sensor histidine kinase and response regulator